METSVKTGTAEEAKTALTGNKLIYRFIDTSVPPEYHRSYTIQVEPRTVRITVDSYGQVLEDQTHAISEHDFRKFLNALQSLKIDTIEPAPNEGCSGGTTHKFDIVANQMTVNGQVYHCGGKRYGNLAGDTDAAARLFETLVPKLSRMKRN